MLHHTRHTINRRLTNSRPKIPDVLARNVSMSILLRARREGTYALDVGRASTRSLLRMAERVMENAQNVYQLKEENRQKLLQRQQKAEGIREARDFERYRDEEKACVREKGNKSRRRAHQIHPAFHEPVKTNAGHGVDKVSPDVVSRSDFPMVPYHQSSESSSSRECVSGDRLKTQAGAVPPSFGSTTRFVGPPSRQIPPECRPYPAYF
ncbi:hypothetical protein Moror_2243 [Moniliophthora roreri MCA 2997]|uniref:Uncharacterized protein n=2 Tax=Moniliophthora roreri TaxID=221103 RepID=V2XSA6_MONRO|nr:hypothetical protein Moror_2243 [Moniliophthora roreri MCA 2997]